MRRRYYYYAALLCLILTACSIATPSINTPTTSVTTSPEFLDIPPCTVAFIETEVNFCQCYTDLASPSGTYRFFTTCISTCPSYSGQPVDAGIYVAELVSARTYRLDSECFLTYRPVVRQAWLSDNILAFIISSNPHYGWYFEVDMVTQEMIKNHPVSDEPGASSMPIP